MMSASLPNESASAVPVFKAESSTSDNSNSSNNKASALNALTLQTIQDQQLIIERQKELVNTLKQRVEELEKEQQQQQQQQQRSAVNPKSSARHPSSSVSSKDSYAAQVLLQRRLQSSENEKAELQTRVTALQEEVHFLSEHFAAHQLHHRQVETSRLEAVREAERRAVAATQLLEALDQRNGRLTEQCEKLRREAELQRYAAAQWHALISTVVAHLDSAQSRHTREQMAAIEDDVRRFQRRQTQSSAAVCSTAGVNTPLSLPPEEAAELAATRHLWSRTAQVSPPFTAHEAAEAEDGGGKTGTYAPPPFCRPARAEATASFQKVESEESRAASSGVASAEELLGGVAAKDHPSLTKWNQVVKKSPSALQGVQLPPPAIANANAHAAAAAVRPAHSDKTPAGVAKEKAAHAPRLPGLQSNFMLSSQVLPLSRADKGSA